MLRAVRAPAPASPQDPEPLAARVHTCLNGLVVTLGGSSLFSPATPEVAPTGRPSRPGYSTRCTRLYGVRHSRCIVGRYMYLVRRISKLAPGLIASLRFSQQHSTRSASSLLQESFYTHLPFTSRPTVGCRQRWVLLICTHAYETRPLALAWPSLRLYGIAMALDSASVARQSEYDPVTSAKNSTRALS